MATFEQTRPRWVYCISEGMGEPIKVGVTQSVRSRLSTLNGHTWRDVRVFWAVPGTAQKELKIKHALREHLIRNEWFHDPHDVVKGAISGDDWRLGGRPWEHKEWFHKAIKGAPPSWIYWGHRSYDAFCNERYFRFFDSAQKDRVESLAASLGVDVQAHHFRPRTYEAVETLISELQEKQSKAA